jgi:hypothetical protein
VDKTDPIIFMTVSVREHFGSRLWWTRTDPIIFMTVSVREHFGSSLWWTGLYFLHAHGETSVLAGELPEESDQFRFLRVTHLTNLKGSVGLIFNQRLRNEGYYSHRFVYVTFHTSPSIL